MAVYPSESFNLSENEPTPVKNLWYAIVGRATITALAYPFEYVKVLVQIGHEPLPPKPTRRLLGKPALALPGAFEYMKYIKKVDGYAGLYRGLSVRLVGNVVSGAVFSEVNRKLPEVREFEDEEDDDDITEEERIINFVKRTLKLMTAKCAALVCAQPFNVVTVRCMAQFVGREEKYAGIFSSIGEIYREEGIMGLFSGLVPRLIGEVLTIWFASTIAFVINAYIVQDKTLQSYISATTLFLSSSVTYPFTLVGTVMAVSGSSLQAGTPPAMPIYPSWTECWRHLSSTGQLKRGSAILWRYYQGPYIVDERGVPMPAGSVKLLKASQ
ncbi:mitochondrial carrier homolog 2 [Ixodes scapularis]|nr:mitochondrial carrier homolog 2 [Ixodes scapularis]